MIDDIVYPDLMDGVVAAVVCLGANDGFINNATMKPRVPIKEFKVLLILN